MTNYQSEALYFHPQKRMKKLSIGSSVIFSNLRLKWANSVCAGLRGLKCEGKEYTLKPEPVGRGLQCVFFTRMRRRFHSSPKCHPLRDILLTKLTFLLTVWQIIFIIRFLKNIKQCVLLYLQVNKYTLFDDLWSFYYKNNPPNCANHQ